MVLLCGWLWQDQVWYYIFGRDILTLLSLNLKISEHVIKADDGPLKGSTLPMVDLGTYQFKDLNTGTISPE